MNLAKFNQNVNANVNVNLNKIVKITYFVVFIYYYSLSCNSPVVVFVHLYLMLFWSDVNVSVDWVITTLLYWLLAGYIRILLYFGYIKCAKSHSIIHLLSSV